MSFEDDILATVKDLIQRSKEIVTYTGVVGGVDTVNNIVNVTVDGAQAPTPCLPLDHRYWTGGQRVVIMRAAGTWYVIGVLGLQTVVRLPSYTGTHPSGTNPGEMWYRSDTNHAYVNVNGTPTQVDN